jgi:replicative DNA helicase
MTVPVLNGLIEKYKPDIIGIDQFSLMNDARAEKGDPTRIKLAHISEDLYNSSEKYSKPIIADAQANRKASEKKKGDTEADTPELDEIQEADAIGQNSSRVISIKQSAAGLKVTVKKNRYGLNNKEFLYFWDIDKGYFKKINMLPTHSEQPVQAASEGEFAANGTEVF